MSCSRAWRGLVGALVILGACESGREGAGAEVSAWVLESGEPDDLEVSLDAQRVALASLRVGVSGAELRALLPWVDPYEQLAPYVRFTEVAGADYLDVFADPGRHVLLARVNLPPHSAPAPRPPLAEAHIIVDPGHFGAAWAETEHRSFPSVAGPVREGDLNWATGRILADRLRGGGATVQLIRDPPPLSPWSDDLLATHREREARLWWLEVPPWRWPKQVTTGASATVDAFDLFNAADLRRRAQTIDRAAPTLTLSLHYNSCGEARRNGVIVFAYGNTMPGELWSSSQRYWALRRLLEGTLAESFDLGRRIGLSLQRRLDLPVIGRAKVGGSALSSEADTDVEERSPVPTSLPVDLGAGLYVRNLAILRRAPGPIVLVEGPCMNDPVEGFELRQAVARVDGVPTPARAFEVAEAVEAAVREFLAER